METRIPPPIYALAAGVAMWFVADRFPAGVIDFPGQAIVAVGLSLLGAAIDLTSMGGFFKAKTTVNPLRPESTSALVTSGFYRVTRNPMYLGMGLLLTAWAIWLGHPGNVIPIAAYVWLITRYQIAPEERAMEAQFGEAYRNYKRKVRRWI